MLVKMSGKGTIACAAERIGPDWILWRIVNLAKGREVWGSHRERPLSSIVPQFEDRSMFVEPVAIRS